MRQFASLVLVALVASLSLIGSSSAATITGNTGPGGVGATNVASSLLYWLEADNIAGGNGAPVSSWNDTRTITPNNFTQGNATQQPTLVTSGINGRAAVSFDAAANPNHDKLVLGTSTNPRTIIVVNQVGVGQTGSCCVGLIGIDGGDYGIRREQAVPTTWRGTTAQTPALTVASDFTFTAGSQMFVNGANTATAAEGLNHILFASNNSASTFTTTGLGDYFLAAGARPWKGLMGEVIAYNTVLSATQRVIIDNYLSAKFDIPLNTANGALDVYDGDNTGTDYDHDVFGIGNDGATAVFTSGSHGFGIEERNTSLGTNEWVLAGHAVQTNSIVDIEGTINGERWDRAWAVNVNGSTLDARLAFDFDDADLAAFFDSNDDFSLLYSATSGLTWEILELTPTVNIANKLITFDLDGLEGGFYTLGINATPPVPEPSTLLLLSFGAASLAYGRRRVRR